MTKWKAKYKKYWYTADGDVMPMAKMDSKHLFNSIRMVFNNIAPPELQIPGGNKYADIKDWDPERCHYAIKYMIEELEMRQNSSLSEFFSPLSDEELKQIEAIKVYNEMRMI